MLSSSVAKPERLTPKTASKLVSAYVKAPDFDRVDAAMRSRTFGSREPLDEAARQLPIHVVWGGKDRLVVPPKEPLPDSVVQHHLKGAGHLPQFDEPEGVIAIVEQAIGAATAVAPSAAIAESEATTREQAA